MAVKDLSDHAALRRAMLAEAVQSPVTLIPLALAVVSSVWALSVSLDVVSGLAAVTGATVGSMSFLYQILVRGDALRDQILAKWNRAQQALEKEQRADLMKELQRKSLNRAAGLTLKLYESFDAAREVAESAGPATAAQFVPLLEENLDDALILLRKLLDCDDGELPDQEPALVHVTSVIRHFEATKVGLEEIVAKTTSPAQRNLRELEETLTLTRKAYQELEQWGVAEAAEPNSAAAQARDQMRV